MRPRNAASSFVSHSQITSVCHPMASRLARCSASRSTFRLSFASQYPLFDPGSRPSGHPGCWCQKQPCTKIALRRGPNTRSGFPGRSFRCSRYRYPIPWTSFRTASSGFIPLLLILRMFSERRSVVSLSTTRLSSISESLLPKISRDSGSGFGAKAQGHSRRYF